MHIKQQNETTIILVFGQQKDRSLHIRSQGLEGPTLIKEKVKIEITHYCYYDKLAKNATKSIHQYKPLVFKQCLLINLKLYLQVNMYPKYIILNL